MDVCSGGSDFFARSPFSFKSEIILGAGPNEIVPVCSGKTLPRFPSPYTKGGVAVLMVCILKTTCRVKRAGDRRSGVSRLDSVLGPRFRIWICRFFCTVFLV